MATIRLHKAALAAEHKAAGHDDPTENEGVRRVMKGIARAHGRSQKHARPLTGEALAAVKATAKSRRSLGDGKRQESAERASWRGRVDLALLSVLRDGLLRRSEAAALTLGDVEFRDNGSALITVRRSKTYPEAEGVALYIGKEAAQALLAIRPADELLDPSTPVFGLTTRHIGNRVKAAGPGEGYTGRVGMAQDLAKNGVELPALMTAGRWKSSRMPARYTERQAAGRGAVVRYYRGRGGNHSKTGRQRQKAGICGKGRFLRADSAVRNANGPARSVTSAASSPWGAGGANQPWRADPAPRRRGHPIPPGSQRLRHIWSDNQGKQFRISERCYRGV